MNPERRLRAVMLDWAGTTVDHGSMAPVIALQALFARYGIVLPCDDVRRDMGLLKRDHIQKIFTLADVRARWLALTGREPGDEDVASLFEEFIPLQKSILPQNSMLIEGVAETVAAWQRRGLRVGTTTGYTREMLEPILLQAIAGGYRPDATVCPDEAAAGRPAPWMLMRNAQLLDVYPPSACVKIGDTVSDIEEGINAGMWTIGVTRTGNLVGMDAIDWAQLSAQEKARKLKSAEDTLRRAGADFVAEDLPACDGILAQIEQRLNDGNSPGSRR
jgi:phosphonoacetaldehyde hydrolase